MRMCVHVCLHGCTCVCARTPTHVHACGAWVDQPLISCHSPRGPETAEGEGLGAVRPLPLRRGGTQGGASCAEPWGARCLQGPPGIGSAFIRTSPVCTALAGGCKRGPFFPRPLGATVGPFSQAGSSAVQGRTVGRADSLGLEQRGHPESLPCPRSRPPAPGLPGAPPRPHPGGCPGPALPGPLGPTVPAGRGPRLR